MKKNNENVCRAPQLLSVAGDQSTCLSFRITNGGKSTLSQSLHQQIPNSCIIAQDSYFKVVCEGLFSSHWWPLHVGLLCMWSAGEGSQCHALSLQEDSVVPVDSSGFKQYDSEFYATFSNQSCTQKWLSGQTVRPRLLLFVCLFWSAWRSAHGHNDEPRGLVAEQSWVLPEGARPEHGACGTARPRGGVCAHRGGLPHLQPQVSAAQSSQVCNNCAFNNCSKGFFLKIWMWNFSVVWKFHLVFFFQALERAVWPKILPGNSLWCLQN